MHRLNTAVVTASASRLAGGLFSSVRRLHQALCQEHSVNVRVFALHDSFSNADQGFWQPLNIATFPVTGPRMLGYSPALRQSLLASDTDIGHTHGLWMYSSLATHDWHRKTRRPYIVSPHGMLDPWAVRNSAWKKRLALMLYERSHLRHAACIRALCKSEALSIRQVGLTNPICVIPNGIDLPVSTAAAPPWEKVVNPGSRILLFLSRIHPKKGIVNLLKAWAKCIKSGKENRESGNWVLAIAGWDQGGHEEELKQLASELGLKWVDIRDQKSANGNPGRQSSSSLLFLGPQFDHAKDTCYHHCDAFVLPSLSEGLPMVVLEAWANSKPVVMTPECNLPDGFQAGAALRVEPTVSSLTAGLNELHAMSVTDRLAMGNRGQDLVAKRFTWTHLAHQMQAVQLWILGSGAKPDCITDY